MAIRSGASPANAATPLPRLLGHFSLSFLFFTEAFREGRNEDSSSGTEGGHASFSLQLRKNLMKEMFFFYIGTYTVGSYYG